MSRRKKGEKEIEAALQRVLAYIGAWTDQDSVYSRGLSSEGYFGGYAQALRDVGLVLHGIKPNFGNTSEFWEGMIEEKK